MRFLLNRRNDKTREMFKLVNNRRTERYPSPKYIYIYITIYISRDDEILR